MYGLVFVPSIVLSHRAVSWVKGTRYVVESKGKEKKRKKKSEMKKPQKVLTS